jgi:peptidoglycan biosynthesis protein MviN/MurJ (putative lipid II flippase)
MLALAGINIVKKAFFALDDRNSLLAVGVLGLAFTVALGYPLSRRLGVQGLGLSLSLSAALQLALYLVILKRRMGTRLGLGLLALPLLKMLAASVPAAMAAWAVSAAGEWERGPASLLNWSLLVAAGVAAGGAYIASGWMLGIAPPKAVRRRGGSA